MVIGVKLVRGHLKSQRDVELITGARKFNSITSISVKENVDIIARTDPLFLYEIQCYGFCLFDLIQYVPLTIFQL